jgi:membrane-anchored protein YejM (alkaline phosphatase superfamily)
LALILIYFVIFTSWIGHYRSITHWPYSSDKVGITRFIVSLFALYLYYHSVNLLAEVNRQYYDDTLLYILPSIFGIYLVYDGLKNWEYRKEAKAKKKDIIYRTIITAVFLGGFIGSAVVYYFLIVTESLHFMKSICKPIVKVTDNKTDA